jgi:hypothetical protein
MITNKASLFALCLIASSTITQKKQSTFSQNATEYAINKKNTLITHIKENKKLYRTLGFSVTSLIGFIITMHKLGKLEQATVWLQNIWYKHTESVPEEEKITSQQEDLSSKDIEITPKEKLIDLITAEEEEEEEITSKEKASFYNDTEIIHEEKLIDLVPEKEKITSQQEDLSSKHTKSTPEKVDIMQNVFNAFTPKELSPEDQEYIDEQYLKGNFFD